MDLLSRAVTLGQMWTVADYLPFSPSLLNVVSSSFVLYPRNSNG